MTRHLLKPSTIIFPLLSGLIFILAGCMNMQPAPYHVVVTPTTFVTPQCDPAVASDTQTDGSTIPDNSNKNLGFQIRLPLLLPPGVTWKDAFVMPTGQKIEKDNYVAVPFFQALYGIYVYVSSNSSSYTFTEQGILALDETTDTLSPTDGITTGIMPLTINDQNDETIGKSHGKLLHLVQDTPGNAKLRVTMLLWKEGTTTLRMYTVTGADLTLSNLKHNQKDSYVLLHSWPRGDDRTLLQIARSVTIFSGCNN